MGRVSPGEGVGQAGPFCVGERRRGGFLGGLGLGVGGVGGLAVVGDVVGEVVGEGVDAVVGGVVFEEVLDDPAGARQGQQQPGAGAQVAGEQLRDGLAVLEQGELTDRPVVAGQGTRSLV
jgi:hypothetical protein